MVRGDRSKSGCAHVDRAPWLSVCVPAHNEQASIVRVTNSIAEAQGSRGEFEIVIVNDASVDATQELVQGIHSRDPGRVKVVQNEKQLGLGGSLQRGIQASTGEIFTWIPADGEYEPGQVLNAIDSRLSEAQLLIFVRTRRDGSVRNGATKVLYLTVYRLFGVRLRDYCGIFAVRRSQLELLPVRSTSTFFTIEVLMQARRLGWQVLECPIT